MAPKRKDPDLSTYSGRAAQRLKDLREKRKLTVDDVVEHVNRSKTKPRTLTRKTYYNWEAAISEPAQDFYPILAQVFGLKTARSLLPDN